VNVFTEPGREAVAAHRLAVPGDQPRRVRGPQRGGMIVETGVDSADSDTPARRQLDDATKPSPPCGEGSAGWITSHVRCDLGRYVE
jgi:hypothetical protein